MAEYGYVRHDRRYAFELASLHILAAQYVLVMSGDTLMITHILLQEQIFQWKWCRNTQKLLRWRGHSSQQDAQHWQLCLG